MKLASYIGTREGFMGVGNFLIRIRLGGEESHTEIMFEPSDNVDSLMPDGSCDYNADGALWHASSVGLERIPLWSPRRPNKLGGVRFKRIIPDEKWVHDNLTTNPMEVARKAHADQGRLYDWQSIANYLIWILPNKLSRGSCSEVVAEWLGVAAKDAYLFSPRSIRSAIKGLQ